MSGRFQYFSFPRKGREGVVFFSQFAERDDDTPFSPDCASGVFHRPTTKGVAERGRGKEEEGIGQGERDHPNGAS